MIGLALPFFWQFLQFFVVVFFFVCVNEPIYHCIKIHAALLTEILNEATEKTTEATKTERELEPEVAEEPEEELSRKGLEMILQKME